MKKQLQERLIITYQYLYKKDGISPFSMYGFDVPDGWYNIIDTLSNSIVFKAKQMNIECPEIFSVKQKYGMLRYDLRECVDEFKAVTNLAIKASTQTCSVCGEKGLLYDDNKWITVYCENHARGKLTDPWILNF